MDDRGAGGSSTRTVGTAASKSRSWRRFPTPMAAPLALFLVIAVTSVFGGWTPDDSDALLLLPSVGEGVTATDLTVRISAAQALWFTGLALTGWLSASRLPARLAPAVGGLAAPVLLT